MILKIDSFWSKIVSKTFANVQILIFNKKKIVNTKTHKKGFLLHAQYKPQDFNLAACDETEKKNFCITTNSLSSIQCHEVVWETGYMDVI